MLTACCGRAAAARSGHSATGKASSDQAARLLGPTLTTHGGRRQLPTDGRCSRASSLSWSATGRPAPLPTTSHDDDQVQVDSPLAQHGLRQLRGPAPTSGRRRAVVDTAGDHADSGPSQPCGAGPRHARDLFPVGHSGRRNARTPDAGRWRPDSGHLDAQTPAPDTGHWTGPVEHRTLAPDTGHRMLDTNADTVTTAQLASGPPWPPRERPQAETPNRACALARPAGCSAAPPAKPRPAYCCPQTITSRA